MEVSEIKSLVRIVEHFEHDEKKHFEESNSPKNHIYRDIKKMREWLENYQVAGFN